MDLNELERNRYEKIARLRELGMEPYPTRSNPSHTTVEAMKAFEEAEAANPEARVEVTVAGRLRSMRPMGKISFAHVEDRAGRLQLFFRVNTLGEEKMTILRDLFDLGDYIQASGFLFRTKTGEISVHVEDFTMLAKAISPLPAAKDEVVDGKVVRHATLNDPETRFRQRYADLAVNSDVRKIFRLRTETVRAIREYLDNLDFIEVETPILQPIYGGAAARPFVTHHNQLKQDLYLRISFELYLKRLVVGMFDRVYEIGRDFRNEGVSFKHNPEFTQLEYYMAYADYLKVMEITENMVAHVADRVLGTRKATFKGNEIDLNPPWRRLELRQGLMDAVGIDIHAHREAESLAAAMQAKGIKPKPGAPWGKLVDQLLGDFLEPNLIQPTFLYDYPRDISPLAKSKPGDPQTVERFEGFVGGMELCNAFTELNDPLDQESRFLEMGRAYEDEDEERHPMDDDYLQAMKYGMPPQGGFGMGIDRLVMLLADKHSIREVILFPHLRDRDDEK
ncbi:lysyl-tRNA synthetase [Ornatilinea apprima]|uniref:Lysine--tRNA ligase n=1 Tax=Ornatilinea apprima TaxID=1134406 RepID=A0A0N8GL35_9CHLR|nr:lysine--tRNA ligase [Ornatilinea apprima]KPL71394.1 lysyl-tRNA synthetase [Ornatilinea apprima]